MNSKGEDRLFFYDMRVVRGDKAVLIKYFYLIKMGDKENHASIFIEGYDFEEIDLFKTVIRLELNLERFVNFYCLGNLGGIFEKKYVS